MKSLKREICNIFTVLNHKMTMMSLLHIMDLILRSYCARRISSHKDLGLIHKMCALAKFVLPTELVNQNRSELTGSRSLSAICILPRPHFSIKGHMLA